MTPLNMKSWTFCIGLVFLSQLSYFQGVLALTCKTYYTSNSSLFYYEYCSVGCCGTERSFECCSPGNTGAIVGGVVGAILFFLFVGAVTFICWQNSKKKKQMNVDVEPEIDELGYELEMMGDLPQYQSERDFFHSPLSPSHLQDDFRNQSGITDTEILSDMSRHPLPSTTRTCARCLLHPGTKREKSTRYHLKSDTDSVKGQEIYT